MTDATFSMPARSRLAASRSQPARPRQGKGVAQGFATRMLRSAMRRPGRALLYSGIAAVGVVIAINALMLQSKRHPAPLHMFGADAAKTQSAPPLPPVRPAAVEAAQPQLAPLPPTQRAAVSAGTPAQAVAQTQSQSLVPPMTPPGLVKNPGRDPIGDLIREGRPSEPRGSDPQRPVAAAQKALIKLGYGVAKADGVYGEATRSAIERFERDRKLPVTGELAPRTMRELTAASGVKVE